jgi:hypothetical protein
MILDAITIYQPYASWIAEGWKTIETRENVAGYKGLLGKQIAIHAGQVWYEHALDTAFANGWLSQEERDKSLEFENTTGAILCIARVSVFEPSLIGTSHSTPDIGRQAMTDEWYGRCGMYLSDVKKFPSPVPVRGRKGVWKVNLRSVAGIEHMQNVKAR